MGDEVFVPPTGLLVEVTDIRDRGKHKFMLREQCHCAVVVALRDKGDEADIIVKPCGEFTPDAIQQVYRNLLRAAEFLITDVVAQYPQDVQDEIRHWCKVDDDVVLKCDDAGREIKN